MLIATVLGVLIVPGLFVMIENIGKKKEDTKETTENNKDSNTTGHDD
jgi:hydrophobic/amphiphilic exporter-1 (mainly G- bacteria), HAE1 family